MSIKAGVWIDHHKAILVRMNTDGEEITHINSDVEKPFSSAAGSGPVASTLRNYQSENKQEHKFMNQLNGFYDEVLKALSGADPLLIRARRGQRGVSETSSEQAFSCENS